MGYFRAIFMGMTVCEANCAQNAISLVHNRFDTF